MSVLISESVGLWFNKLRSSLTFSPKYKNSPPKKEIKIAKAPKAKDIVLPEELLAAFKSDKDFQTAFKALTPGRQKEYAQHIASAKQEKTRVNRLEKAKPLILDGKGLHDKYKNC